MNNVVSFPNKKEVITYENGPVIFDDHPIKDDAFHLSEDDFNNMVESYFKNTGAFSTSAEIIEVYGVEFNTPKTEDGAASYTLHVTYMDLDNTPRRDLINTLETGPKILFDKTDASEYDSE